MILIMSNYWSNDHDSSVETHCLVYIFSWWQLELKRGCNQQGGMFLWCGMRPFVVTLWHFHVAGRNFEENPPTLKTKMTIKSTKDFLARWMWWLAIFVCKTCSSGFECLWVWWKSRVLSILEDGCHHTVAWQRYCRKVTIQVCRSLLSLFVLVGMCVTRLHSRGIDRE